jgi:hypothetical protein
MRKKPAALNSNVEVAARLIARGSVVKHSEVTNDHTAWLA